MKRIWMLVCICMLLCGLALAQEAPEVAAGTLTASLPVKGGHVQVYSTQVDGEEWLLLPAFADMDALQLTMDGESVLWEDVTEEDGVWTGDAVKDGETLFTLSAMRSENLRALFLFSDDPVNQGREYIESSKKHENQTTGAMAIVNVDGKVDHADDLRQLRGRGNSTWFLEKKPYQFKLENRADLLNTGVKSERSRTWVLLADFYDSTMLHNRVMLDLGLEIGLAETSHSEHVDLYYDGEYRGLYLLCEKVEVDEARLDWDDYDAVIDAINKSAGIRDLSVLEAEVGEQETGYYSYIRDLAEPEDPSVGTYMVEMENPAITLSDRCWFYLDDGSVLALKNPENASKNMVRYISARLAEAQKTLIHGGVNPETGRTLSDDFDVEGFARNLLLQELAHNADGYTYSSSWFILPAQQTRFEAGPLWDFDLSLRIRREGTNAEGVGLRALKSWPQLFYGCDAFVETMQRIYREEIAPVVEKILLGSEQGRYLRPLQEYVREIRAARAMNERIWPGQRYFEFCYEEGFDAEIEAMRRFLEKRHAWLKQALEDAKPYSADAVTLWGNAEYGHVDTNLQLHACTWNNVDIVSYEWDMVSEATEEDYAVYELEAIIAPQEGYAFEEPSVTFGGVPISHERLEDGSLRILVTFEDPSYRPVDYYGDDIGLVFNPEVYAANYPEIAAEYEGDPEGLMDYFCDDGMYEDHKGNAFFKPSEILRQNPGLEEMLGEDWQMYYWDFIYYGYDDGWLQPGISPGFALEVTEALE